MSVRTRVADKHHKWLSQVEVSGIVLSEPVLADIAPTGFRALEKRELAEFYKARDIWNLPGEMAGKDQASRWVDTVLGQFLRLSDHYWRVGASVPTNMVANLSEVRETIRPTRVLMDEDQPVMLFVQVPRTQRLDSVWTSGDGAWKASPTTKTERLLRETGVELALLTNGDAWRLIVASPSETTSWLTWTTQTWGDSPSTLAAFIDLLGETRFFAGPRNDVILELIRKSRERQIDVADQLGNQVRQALGLFIHELDRIDESMNGALLASFSDEEIFEAGVAFIMRVIFLLYAEENGLLPHGTVAYDQSYGVLHLLVELENQNRLSPQKLNNSYEGYSRLLAVFRLVFDGSPDPDIRVAPHGGGLFDPGRYPLLEGRKVDGSWLQPKLGPLMVRDTVVREVLRSLKYARSPQGIVQLVSYRTLAVEQIGHMYEGLLERRVTRAGVDAPVLLLAPQEPSDVPSLTVEELSSNAGELLVELISRKTGKTEAVIRKLLFNRDENRRLPEAGTSDPELLQLAEPVRAILAPRGVVRAGGIFLTESSNRRSQGAHYTPTILTEPVVRTTLEPLAYESVDGQVGRFVEPRQVRSPEELLDIKVCDPAMGSAAFLVQVVRFLGERLVDSWDQRMAAQPGVVLTLPFGQPAAGGPDEQLMPDNHDERLLWARRIIAQQCVYGVDKNPLAVEMAKLSLWLVTLSKDHPFSFLDHCLKSGDSLLGATSQQVKSWSMNGQGNAAPLLATLISKHVDSAVDFRTRIECAPVRSVRDSRVKRNLLAQAEGKLAFSRIASDALLSTILSESTVQAQLRAQSELISRIVSQNGNEDQGALPAEIQTNLRGHNPFHWFIEFPEIFIDRDGFDAMVGNPPFLGGRLISGQLGDEYLRYLQFLVGSKVGQTDLSAYFFRRAEQLVRTGGTFGFIATNTISQGDTQKVGLSYLVQHNISIYSAEKSFPWPGKAAVVVSKVHCFKGRWQGLVELNGKTVSEINDSLQATQKMPDPVRLAENLSKSFKGIDLGGTGFALSAEETREFLRQHPEEAGVIFPYMNGKELYASSTLEPTRSVINFFDWPLEKAKQYPFAFEIVENRVHAYRKTVNQKIKKEKWWIYERNRPGLNKAIAGKKRVLAKTHTSSTWAFAFLPAGIVFDQALIVFPMEDYHWFASLQSELHFIWANRNPSTMKTDPRYSTTSCFETFPFPNFTPELDIIGSEYYNFRSQVMLDRGIGLTSIYNLFHDSSCADPDILRLRELQQSLETAMARAYKWPVDEIRLDWVTESNDQSSEGSGESRFSYIRETKQALLYRLTNLNLERAGISTIRDTTTSESV